MRYLVILLLISCASNKVNYPKLQEKDFKKNTKYRKQNIEYSSEKAVKGLLVSETINRVYNKVDLQAKNILSGILLNCYEGDFDKAHEVSKKYYVDYSKNVVYWNTVGTCFLLEGKYLKADLYFNKGLELNKRYAPIYNNKAVLKTKLGDDSAALALLTKAVKLDRRSLTPKFNMGQIYLKYTILPKAKDIFVYLYKKFPQDDDVLNGLALISTSEGNYAQAVKVYSNINIKKFEHANYGLGFAISLNGAGRRKAALGILDEIDQGSKAQIKLAKDLKKRWSK